MASIRVQILEVFPFHEPPKLKGAIWTAVAKRSDDTAFAR